MGQGQRSSAHGAVVLAAAGLLLIACSHRPLPIGSPEAGGDGAAGRGAGGDAGSGAGGAGIGGSGAGGAGIGGAAGCAILCAADQACVRGSCQNRLTEFALPSPYIGTPMAITVGPDGNLWFVELNGGIGRVTLDGVITEFPLLPNTQPESIVSGPDGNLWFTEYRASTIGKMAPDGKILALYNLPGSGASAGQGAGPDRIVSAPDGHLWFTEYLNSAIARMATDGTYVEYATPTGNAKPLGITVGTGGDLWFTEGGVAAIGTIAPSGRIREIAVGKGFGSYIAVGPNGDLWLTESMTLEQVLANGTSTIVPTTCLLPWEILTGPDRRVWFTCYFERDRIGRLRRVNTDGTISEFPVAHLSDGATFLTDGLVTGPDGNLWFTEGGANLIGRFIPP
jgi:streptogramin lyase